MPIEAVTTNLFEKHCEDIARGFVQTMVFMDDQAGYETPTIPEQTTAAPAKGIARRATKKSIIQIENNQSHPLNVADILESAMKSGLVCSVHKPQCEDDFKLENLQAILSADIVCFDWIMKPGDDGEITSGLIKGVLNEDLKVGGRHRLIAVYTFKHELESILKAVQGKILECGAKSEFDNDRMSLTGNHFRILGLLKEGGSQFREQQVNAKELPCRLIKEFSLFNRGLIPSLTMASIAILRESTAHILAKLNSNLDGPFLTHKSLLPTPDNATSYASEIIASEIRAIIHKHRIADELLSDKIIKSFLDSQVSTVLKYLNPAGKEIETEINIDTLYQLITEGLRQTDDEIIDAINLDTEEDKNEGRTTTRSIIAKSLSSFLTNSHETALDNNLEFLRVTNIAADRTSKIYLDGDNGGHGKSPILTLGSIVKQQATYLLCLQPSCDSVRLDSSGCPFWFVKLKKNNEKPMLVVSHENELVGLRYSAIIKDSKLIEFKRTDNVSRSVVAKREDEKLIFSSNGNNPKKYQWIADLKPDIARKIGQELANQYSRIGLDEFELSRMGWKYHN